MSKPTRVQVVFERIDSMSIRERAMVALTVLAVLWALWDGLLMRPLGALEQARQEQLASLTGQITELNRSIQTVATAQSVDPEAVARRQLAETRMLVAELDARLRNATRELVPPSEMATLLETMLTRVGNLQLVGMETLPSQAITVEGSDTGYFRHGLQVDVRGGYLDALTYLRALEQLRWQFLWESVELTVRDHPNSDIRITVYTLGERAGVIGV
ncbi:MAG: hypothetical protein LC632_07000 [Xanthomonadaceae bacterium]|nr:hypothetical protein [Xanthomonadaceae bacterium]